MEDNKSEYFHVLRDEILERLKFHSNYSIGKITSAALLIGFVISKGLPKEAVLIVPILSISLDLIIYHNCYVINKMGKYIRDNLENSVLPSGVVGWEMYMQSSKQKLTDAVDRIGQFLITLVFVLISCAYYFDISKYHSMKYWLIVVIGIYLVFDLIIAFRSTASGK